MKKHYDINDGRSATGFRRKPVRGAALCLEVDCLTGGYTGVILYPVKTAISLPDALFIDAEKIAQSMGIPRSQLFAKAMEEFIIHHKKETITERLNTVYTGFNQDNELMNVSMEAMRRLTKNDAW